MRRLALWALVLGVAVSSTRAQVVRPVLQFSKELVGTVTIDDAGSVIYAVSSTNQFGTNPDYNKQIVRWDPASGIGTPITDYEEGVESVSVSDDGTWLAFVTAADLVGTNHDESTELYVMHPDGTGLAQLTFSTVPPLETRGIRAAVISGSGNRIAFMGDVNLLGTNPTNAMALFVVDRTGANLRQLRTGLEYFPETYFQPPFSFSLAPSFDISDDGNKVVYMGGGINADGTGNHPFSGGTGGIRISGNGAKVVYTLGSTNNYTVRVRSFDGNPGTIVSLGIGERPSITDDATQVFYHRYSNSEGSTPGIYKVASTGGVPPTLVAADLRTACLAGSGNRIVGFGNEFVAMDNAGGNLQQLTTTVLRNDRLAPQDFAMSLDGHMISFQSNIDPLGTNPTYAAVYFSYNVDTSQFWQRTDVDTGWQYTDIAGDGTVAFAAYGGSPCGRQVYLKPPSTAVTPLSDCPGWNTGPEMRPDGQVIVFQSEMADAGLIAVNADGTGRTQITPPGTHDIWFDSNVGVAGAGATTWVAYVDAGNVYRVKGDGSAFQQLTAGASGGVFQPSISADGHVVSMGSYVFDDVTQSIRPIPHPDPVHETSVTADGQWVFVDGASSPARFHVATGSDEYIGGLRRALSAPETVLPDATGSHWVMTQYNPHPFWPPYELSNRTVFVADLDAVPAFTVGKASPTVLSWDPSPFSLRYDVVRGSIANLSIVGSTVNLGPVSCLEDDSPDSHTRGYGDPTDPAPGQAFFFLYRGSVGANAAAGSYGQGTGARERVAGAGGCNP
ncbi:MAG TPA: hypothetical protein VJ826_04520 [Candidatus Polarisedimenticolaceae bacterium]|nr:hypothetical protein [Candidatus Polarisedimenticolaceae bacterium]